MATEIRETSPAAGVSSYVRAHFLCAVVQSRKAPVYFVLSVRPSVCTYNCGSHWPDYPQIDTRVCYENLSRISKFG